MRAQTWFGRGRPFLMLMSATSLAGCSTVQGFQRLPETPEVMNARRAAFFGADADARYDAATSEADRRRIRDDLVYGKMQVLEDDFQDLERALNGSGNAISTGSDFVVLALNGLAATTGGTATKSALAAASAGVVGAQGAINKDLYYQKTLPALLAQMQANREKSRLIVLQNLRHSDADYPLKLAEIDLKRLAEAECLPMAVSQIAQQAEQSKSATDKTIQSLRDLSAVDTPSANRLQAWLYPSGKVDRAHFAALQSWLNAQPEITLQGQGYPPAAFVSGDTDDATLEPIRQRAIDDPTLGIPH